MSDKPPAHFSWSEILTATTGRGVGEPPSSGSLFTVSTDTRSIGTGDVFIPLSGANFDGHDFLSNAFDAGAAAAVVSDHRLEELSQKFPSKTLIAVDNPRDAHLGLARFHRRRVNPTVLALTGSSGKTTTKEMLFAAFAPLTPTQCTQKNFNNEVGVSQTLLALQPETRLSIVEMGMRGLGEIELLSKYAEPDIAMVINVGSAHIGRLGSREDIAQAKCEIFSGLNTDTGVGIINGDNALLSETAPRYWKGDLMAYHLSEAREITNICSGGVSFQYKGHLVELKVPGEHMVSNALAVFKAAEVLELDRASVAQGLSSFTPMNDRGHQYALEDLTNVWVINDAYNANPESTRASIQAFLDSCEPDLKRIIILGGMKELGDASRTYHQEVGEWIGQKAGVDALFLVGEEASWLMEGVQRHAHYPVRILEGTADEISRTLVESLNDASIPLENCCLFLKGSRAYELEKVPPQLKQNALS